MVKSWQSVLQAGVKTLLPVIFAVFAANASAAIEPPAPFTVFAASSLTNVLEEIISDYHKEYQPGLATLSVAGTGTLARQIEAGAPADVFVSADREWIDYLISKQLIEKSAATLVASNRLVLVTKSDRQLSGTLDERLVQLAQTGRIAIGDPEGVPVGRYAKAALQSLQIWTDLEPVLVPTENVRVALALVLRGEVEGAIVYATDAALVPELAVQAVFLPGLHPPISYWAVVIGNAPWTAFDFVASLHSAKTAGIWTAHGFIVP
tara:strand:- start:4582 stop:5373 length:792 start_codon:yes stop_codon:yes gene_type:complete